MKNYLTTFDKPLDFLNKLRVIFYSMVGITPPIFLYIYLESRNGEFSPIYPELSSIFYYIVPIVCVVLTILAYWYYEKQIRAARTLPSLRAKLDVIILSSFNKFLILEIATLFNILIYYLSGQIFYAGVYIAMIIFFGMSNPSIYSVLSDLRLPKREADVMRNNGNI
ncbi:hypothetical protein [Algivirga pacifica]|uniref:DUF2975 domain-containing protein n=1 Tax=Algivirga pacifica TaxID=1162670 RepID=A0ABP9DHV9_9BACT